MSTRSFHSLFMVASCAGAALGCYLVSLRVASERAALDNVETRIVLAQRDLRVLQTEIGTRGRLAQLERWNVKVLALSAPAADQFLGGSFELARLTQPERKVDFQARLVEHVVVRLQGKADCKLIFALLFAECCCDINVFHELDGQLFARRAS